MVLEFGLIDSNLFPSSSILGQGIGADQIVWNDVGVGIVPIGAVVAWCKSLAGCPPLLPSFVECNGQVLADGDSPFDGQIIPNLNASGGGTNRFLRGATASGGTGGAETHLHTPLGTDAGAGVWLNNATGCTHATPQPGSSLPSYYSVVWVMRIK